MGLFCILCIKVFISIGLSMGLGVLSYLLQRFVYTYLVKY